ncbi:MAG TPA: hypothetical protein VIF09_10830, partial [Polyangiaceae bacterium]
MHRVVVAGLCAAVALVTGGLAGCGSQDGGVPPPERLAFTSSALGDDGGEGGSADGGDPCSSATLSASPASPQSPGTTSSVTWTATSGGCGSPQYEFWELAAGGGTPWSVVQAWSSSPTFAWNTSTGVDGTYQFEVWVKDASSTATYDSYAAAPFTLQGAG